MIDAEGNYEEATRNFKLFASHGYPVDISATDDSGFDSSQLRTPGKNNDSNVANKQSSHSLNQRKSILAIVTEI